jgi:dGTPase
MGHDLGHPPFGHIGENVLNERCEHAGLDGFDGNAQGFRIVTKLATRDSPNPGLELSPATLRGLLKYPYLREGQWKDEGKWGVYTSERTAFENALEGAAPGDISIEAEIMDWCDDVSYATHDVEDFYRAGMVPLERLAARDDTEARDEFISRASAALASKSEFNPELGAQAFRQLRAFLNPGTPFSGTRAQRRHLNRMTKTLITRYMGAAKLNHNAPRLTKDPEIHHEVMMLKQLTWQFVVNSPELASVQRGQMKVVRELFDTLMTWVSVEYDGGGGSPYRLPRRLRDGIDFWQYDGDGMGQVKAWLEAHPVDENENVDEIPSVDERLTRAIRARSVADYISSLTEIQALNLHSRLHGLANPSILEAWVRS